MFNILQDNNKEQSSRGTSEDGSNMESSLEKSKKRAMTDVLDENLEQPLIKIKKEEEDIPTEKTWRRLRKAHIVIEDE